MLYILEVWKTGLVAIAITNFVGMSGKHHENIVLLFLFPSLHPPPPPPCLCVQTLCVLVRCVFRKPLSGVDVINILVGFEHAVSEMQVNCSALFCVSVFPSVIHSIGLVTPLFLFALSCVCVLSWCANQVGALLFLAGSPLPATRYWWHDYQCHFDHLVYSFFSLLCIPVEVNLTGFGVQH